MNIGIDIDGVLTDIYSYIIENGSKYFYERGIKIKNPYGYDVADVFEISRQLEDEFWVEFLEDYFDTKIRELAAEVISILKQRGNKIFIITSRGGQDKLLDNEKAKMITKNWLAKNGVEYDGIIFARPGMGKREACEQNSIDVMIDDYSVNALEVSKVCKCILFNAMYNLDIEDANIIRCYSWYDILRIIEELNNI